MESNAPECQSCGSNQLIRKGFRKTKTLGKRQIWRCKACGRKFTPEDQSTGPKLAVAESTPSATCDPAIIDAPQSGEGDNEHRSNGL